MSTQNDTYRPGKAGYVSEFTLFMESLLGRHPEIVRDQQVGWSKFWNHQVNFDELKKAQEDTVPIEDHLGTVSKPD